MLHYTNAKEFCQEGLHHFTYGGSIFSALFITPNPCRRQEAKVPAEGDGGDFNFQPDDWREADWGGQTSDGNGRKEANEGEKGSNETCKNQMKKAN